jgi:hypothetical protein
MHGIKWVKVAVTILTCLLLASPSNSTTIVMLLLKGDRVIVAVDGRQGISVNGKERGYREACKIHLVNDVQFSAAANVLDVESGLDADADAEAVYRSHGTFEERTDKLDRILKNQVRGFMASLRVNNPAEYRKYFDPTRPILSFLIVRYQGSAIVFAILTYHLHPDGTIENNVEIVHEDEQKSGLRVLVGMN